MFKKVISVFLLATILLSVASFNLPKSTFAIDKNDLNDFNAVKDSDPASISSQINNNLTIKFLDPYEIDVKVNLPKRVFLPGNYPDLTYTDALSGIYQLGNSCHWSKEPVTVSIGSSRSITINSEIERGYFTDGGYLGGTFDRVLDLGTATVIGPAFFALKNYGPVLSAEKQNICSIPSASASQAELNDWLTKRQNQLDLVVSAQEKGRDTAYLASQESTGDSKHWLNFNSADVGGTNFYGINISDKVTKNAEATIGITQSYFYSEEVIYSTAEGTPFGYCEKSGDVPLKHVFQESAVDCTSGGDLIYGDNWDSLDKSKIFKLFDSDVTTAYRGAGDKTKDKLIKIAGQNSAISTGKRTGKIPARTNKTEEERVRCETSGGSLSWILCPIINGSLDAAAAIFTGFIEPYLKVKPIDIDGGSQVNGPVIVAWRAFRTIGNIILLFALLFIVFGQSIGGGMVSAYTAKKTLPRILIAAILINLSIYIVAIFADLFNVLGQGMVKLILSAVHDSKQSLIIKPNNASGAAAGTIALLGLATGLLFVYLSSKGSGAVGGGGQMILFLLAFVVIPIVLAALAIFVTLLLRKGILLMLVIISPIAMALFAVPGAEKYTKKWFDALLKTLMVYPIVTGIFAISQLLAVALYVENGGGPIALIGILIVTFAPLFMIPFAFKLAGGIIGTVAGAVTSGRAKINKAYGNDANNPYSLRNKLGRSSRERLGKRALHGGYHLSRTLARTGGEEGLKSHYNAKADKAAKRLGSSPLPPGAKATRATRTNFASDPSLVDATNEAEAGGHAYTAAIAEGSTVDQANAARLAAGTAFVGLGGHNAAAARAAGRAAGSATAGREVAAGANAAASYRDARVRGGFSGEAATVAATYAGRATSDGLNSGDAAREGYLSGKAYHDNAAGGVAAQNSAASATQSALRGSTKVDPSHSDYRAPANDAAAEAAGKYAGRARSVGSDVSTAARAGDAAAVQYSAHEGARYTAAASDAAASGAARAVEAGKTDKTIIRNTAQAAAQTHNRYATDPAHKRDAAVLAAQDAIIGGKSRAEADVQAQITHDATP